MKDPISGIDNQPSAPQVASSEPKFVTPPPIDPTTKAVAAGAPEITCPHCLRPVPILGNPPDPKIHLNCPMCEKAMSVLTFPRLTKEPAASKSGMKAEDSDATCQFYPQLKAEIFCDECGCFMSQKASVDWGDKTLCLPCLHNLRENKADLDYRSELPIWDNRGLALSFTGLVGLFILINNRNSPRSWIPRNSFRWWLAVVLSVGFTILYLSLIVLMFVANY